MTHTGQGPSDRELSPNRSDGALHRHRSAERSGDYRTAPTVRCVNTDRRSDRATITEPFRRFVASTPIGGAIGRLSNRSDGSLHQHRSAERSGHCRRTAPTVRCVNSDRRSDRATVAEPIRRFVASKPIGGAIGRLSPNRSGGSLHRPIGGASATIEPLRRFVASTPIGGAIGNCRRTAPTVRCVIISLRFVTGLIRCG